MEAKSLMILDWVLYNEEPKQITYIYARPLPDGTNPSNEVGWGHNEECWVNASWIEPIPLTPEILEKNGWEKALNHSSYKNNNVTFRVDIDSAMIWLEQEWDDYYPSFSLNYVHELQHALRLCGLNELADNFKVE